MTEEEILAVICLVFSWLPSVIALAVAILYINHPEFFKL